MKVYLLGAGPGDPGLLTLKARDALAAADVVVYDALANDSLLGHARPDAELIYVGKVAGNHALPQHEINALLVRKAKEGNMVARLKGGDPYIFGRGGEEAEELLAAGVPFEEVPGISSTIAAPAYAGIPLTHRDFASSVTIITGHENPDKPGSVHNWQALARSASTLVFVMGMKNLPDIARNLLDAGLDPRTPAALIYRGTTPRQRSLVATLRELPQAAVDAHFTNPSVIVVGKVASLHDKLNWFEKKPLLGKSIVVTRAREQASGLARSLAGLGAEVIQCPTIEIRALPDYAELDMAVARLADYVIVEADGAKRLPLKAHAAHEPVIPPEANQTILVVGASGFGRPMYETVHRAPLAAQALGVPEDTVVTPALWAQFLEHEHLHTRVLVNQADLPQGRELARRLAAGLCCPVCAAALQKEWIECLS